MGKPAGADYLSDDLKHLSRSGYDAIVSLLETRESSELGLSEQEALCKKHGIRFDQLSIPDRSTPPDRTKFIASVKRSHQAIVTGEHLVAHCRAGIGRSGIYTTSVLIRQGMKAEDAFALVSKARGITIPDTQIQRDWVHEHYEAIRQG